MKFGWGSMNWGISILLVTACIVVIKYPCLVGLGTTDSAATLAGALLGAAAIFIGTEITKREQHSRDRASHEELRQRLRIALVAEVVTIFVKHMETAKFFRRAANDLKTGEVEPGMVDFDRYVPASAAIYTALLPQLTALSNEEIDALTMLHSGLDTTRTFLRDSAVENQPLRMMKAEQIAGLCEFDCKLAAKVVSLIAPNRQIERNGEKAALLTEVLLAAAGAEGLVDSPISEKRNEHPAPAAPAQLN